MKSYDDRVNIVTVVTAFDNGLKPLNLIAAGALTAGSSEGSHGNDNLQRKGAKPHTFRPWEVESVDSIDLMDSSLGSLRFQLRGGKIRRVLPRVNDDINGEWATDKGRYAPLDGVNTQEVRNPRVKVGKDGTWETVSLKTALNLVEQLSSKGTKRVIYGATTDCESIVAMNSWAVSNDCELLSLVPNVKEISDKVGLKVYNEDSKESFLPNVRKNVLLIGCDPRIQSPLLNLRLRESYLNGTELWSVGTRGNQTYPVRNLGFGLSAYNRLLKSGTTYPNWDRILVGVDVFRGKDAEAVAAIIKSIAGDKSVRICTTRANESFIRNHSGTKAYGLDTSKNYDVQVLVNITANEIEAAGYNVDSILNESKDTIVITYKGANWRKNAKIILPVLNPFERKASYVSRFGGLRVSQVVTKRNESSKFVYSIENLFNRFPKTTKSVVNGAKAESQAVTSNAKAKGSNSKHVPFIVSIQDYHVEGHPFAEYSSTRAHCSTVFGESQPNFR